MDSREIHSFVLREETFCIETTLRERLDNPAADAAERRRAFRRA